MPGRGSRGRGRGRGRGRSRGRGDGNGPQQQNAQPPASMELRLLANDKFLEKANAADDRFGKMVEATNGGDLPGARLVLADQHDLLALLTWFREGSDQDGSAELVFPPHLTKKQRAHIHTVTKQVGLGALETFSRGVGDGRYISVMRTGAAPKRELSDKQQHKAYHLYHWACDAGKTVSRDEVADMVFTDTVPSDLVEIWNVKSAQQKAVIRLCEAVRAADADALKAAIREGQEAVSAGAWDVTNRVGPLHLAASGGHAQLVELLLQAGAPVDAPDGDGATALQLARRHDQSDVEGVLLRAGAADPEAHHFPGGGSSAPVDSTLDTAAPTPAAEQEQRPEQQGNQQQQQQQQRQQQSQTTDQQSQQAPQQHDQQQQQQEEQDEQQQRQDSQQLDGAEQEQHEDRSGSAADEEPQPSGEGAGSSGQAGDSPAASAGGGEQADDTPAASAAGSEQAGDTPAASAAGSEQAGDTPAAPAGGGEQAGDTAAVLAASGRPSDTAPLSTAPADAAGEDGHTRSSVTAASGDSAGRAAAGQAPRTAPLAEALRDAAANGPTGQLQQGDAAQEEAPQQATKLEATTLETQGQQGSVPLAQAVEEYAQAQRGADGRPPPSERSVSFAGADAATSATQSELDPSDFAAGYRHKPQRDSSGDLRSSGSGTMDTVPDEEEGHVDHAPQQEDADGSQQPSQPSEHDATDAEAPEVTGQLQSEPSLAVGSAELKGLKRPPRLSVGDSRLADSDGFEFRPGQELPETPRSGRGLVAPPAPSESLRVHPTSSGAFSEASSLAAFDSETDSPGGAGRRTATTAADRGGTSRAAQPTSEITPADDVGQPASSSGKMRQLTPELADEGDTPVDPPATWLPADMTSSEAWRRWLTANQGMLAACGAGATALAVVGALMLSSGRRR